MWTNLTEKQTAILKQIESSVTTPAYIGKITDFTDTERLLGKRLLLTDWLIFLNRKVQNYVHFSISLESFY